MKIGLIQHQWQGNKSDTQAYLANCIADLTQQDAELIVLPELHDLPYFCQTEDPKHFQLTESLSGQTAQHLSQLAKKHHCVIIGSIFEERAPGLYHNTAVVFETNGELAGFYRKMHIPDDPGFYEKYYFSPGDTGFQPIKTSIGNLGVLVCWDQWYPEAARAMALRGADLLIYPTAIGWDRRDIQEEQQRQLNAWQCIQQSHAVANGIPVISINRVGHEPDPSGQTDGIAFWGHSFIADQMGDVLAQAPTDQPQTLLTDIDLQQTATVRQTWPFLRDRRIDAYDNLSKRFDT